MPVYTAKNRGMAGDLTLDPSVFPTALAVLALKVVPGGDEIRRRAQSFLLTQRDEPGLWRHWTRDHPYFSMLPPDLDDTSCASAALACDGVGGAAAPGLLLANRTRGGLFFTWVVPRLSWPKGAHGRFVLGQIRTIPALHMFFRSTSARWGDIDAVVNANCLLALGRFRGHERVAAHLLSVLRDGRETSCDKWYDNPFVVRYFLSRALKATGHQAGPAVLQRAASASPASAMETALDLSTRLDWEGALDRTTVSRLLAEQRESGGWPVAALYHGGRLRRRGGTFGEPHPDTPHWGSEAVTTAFCLEALARWQQAETA